MTIDRLLPEPWDPDTLAALERWRQGHLLSMDRGTWIVPAWVDDPVTGELSDGGPINTVNDRIKTRNTAGGPQDFWYGTVIDTKPGRVKIRWDDALRTPDTWLGHDYIAKGN